MELFEGKWSYNEPSFEKLIGKIGKTMISFIAAY